MIILTINSKLPLNKSCKESGYSFDWIRKSRIGAGFMEGSILTCIWSLPNLITLQLSGNGFTGSLPSDSTKFPEYLQYLSIGHNRLFGTMSNELTTKSFIDLSMSHNKIGGVFAVAAANNTAGSSVRAEVNRLSGYFRTQPVDTFESVSVLEGNIFSCASLPGEDSYIANYVCESSSLDVSLIFFGSVAAFYAICSLFVLNSDRILGYFPLFSGIRNSLHRMKEHMFRWITIDEKLFELIEWGDNKGLSCTTAYLWCLKRLSLIAIVFSLLSVFATSIMYNSLSNSQYETHEYQDSYTISAAFIAGMVPAGALLVVFSVFSWGLYFAIFYSFEISSTIEKVRLYEKKHNSHEKIIESTSCGNLWTYRLFRLLYVIVFFIVSMTVNSAYVSNKQFMTPNQVAVVQFFLSIFNTIYNAVIIPHSYRYSSKFLGLTERDRTFQIAVSYFSCSFIVPTFSTLISDPNCFYEAIYGTEVYSYSYFIEECVEYARRNLQCIKYSSYEEFTSFTTPFIYSFQCRYVS